MPVPMPDEQVAFLRNLQRLLTEGSFVASYKFALLRTLAEIAVLKGNDSGGELQLLVSDLASGALPPKLCRGVVGSILLTKEVSSSCVLNSSTLKGGEPSQFLRVTTAQTRWPAFSASVR